MTLPCGVADVDELTTFAETVGTCTIAERGGYRDVIENGRVVLTHGEAKPATAYDRRIAGPHGIRVGMTGAELLAALPAYRFHGCGTFGSQMQCELRKGNGLTPCESFEARNEPTPIFVWFPIPNQLANDDDPPEELAPLLRDVRIVAVVLAMPC